MSAAACETSSQSSAAPLIADPVTPIMGAAGEPPRGPDGFRSPSLQGGLFSAVG